MAALGKAGTQFAETPQQTGLPEGFPLVTHGQQASAGELRPETYYQANVAFQRDIGFSTTAEVAWVGNFGRNFWRLKDSNNIAPYAYADPRTSSTTSQSPSTRYGAITPVSATFAICRPARTRSTTTHCN